jgi:hypothetical protein
MSTAPKTDTEKYSFDWLLGRDTVSLATSVCELQNELAEMRTQRDMEVAVRIGLAKDNLELIKELENIGTTTLNGVPNMTLCDYFAGQALCGFISASANRDVLAKLDAGMCYLMADSMIIARNQEAAK